MAISSASDLPVPSAGQPLVTRMRGALSGVQRAVDAPAVRRALPAITVTAALGIAAAMWFLISEPARMPLYPGLPEAEKAAMNEALSAAGIPAVLDSRSGEVTVAEADFHRARLALAAVGLPQAMPEGGAILSELPMGTSRSVEQAALRAAQEADLARSIMEIGGVQGARVHLALPERSAFLRDSEGPSASVFLALAPGRTLDAGQVEAIGHLVASSVPGMTRGAVTVVDQQGRLLSQPGDDPAAIVADREMGQRLALERLYRDRIESLLAPVTGAGNLSVQVTIDMDFTRSEIRSERVDPDATAVLSEQESLSESTTPEARGIPGAVSNTPPVAAPVGGTGAAAPAPAAAAPGQALSRTSDMTRNYEISRTIETTIPQTARIMRISAAILVRAPGPAADGTQPPADPARMETIAALARSAIGFDDSRGDSVTVMEQPFAEEAIPLASAPAMAPWMEDVLRQGILLAALAIIGLGILRPLLMRVLQPAPAATPLAAEAPADRPGLPGGTVEVAPGETLDILRDRIEARRRALTEAAMGAGASREDRFAALRQLVADDPGRIAAAMQRMLRADADPQG